MLLWGSLVRRKSPLQVFRFSIMSTEPALSAEESVGIACYVTNSRSISGILKQRFSDFVVREVTKHHPVPVRLESIDGKDLEAQHFPRHKAAVDATEEDVDRFIEQLEAIKDSVTLVLSQSEEVGLREFLMQCVDKDEEAQDSFVAFQCQSKESRTQVHKLIKLHLPQIVEADTVAVNEKQHIRLLAKHKRGAKQGGDVRRSIWPQGLGNYLQFTLLKENVDTMSAIGVLHKFLRTKAGGVDYSGTKDKRAVTAQLCTVYRRKPSDFNRLNASNCAPFIRAGDFKYVSSPLALGDNAGNHFDITIREVDASEDDINATLTTVRSVGFINYFGLQRFGKGGVQSHRLGREIFFSNWQQFISMMFVPKEGDRDLMVEAKAAFNCGDYNKALDLLPRSQFRERAVAEWLAKAPNDFSGAFTKIPKDTRLLCAHAYQSYVWNTAVSARIRRFGLVCVEGDLVAAKQDGGGEELAHAQEVFQHAGSENHSSVVYATKEDITAGTYSISDVLMPLIGIKIKLPQHEIADVYKDILAKDGLSLEFFEKQCSPEYRMGGAYRRLMQRTADLEWKAIRYSDPNAELCETEMTLLRPSRLATTAVAPDADATKLALQLSFTLPPGSYATMLLREITKESTETAFHSSLTGASELKASSKRAREEEEGLAPIDDVMDDEGI